MARGPNSPVLTAPPAALPARVDVHIRGAIPAARVESHAPDEIRMIALHLVHGARDQLLVLHRDPSIAIGVDHHVGRIAVLMPAVMSRSLHLRVERRRPKA